MKIHAVTGEIDVQEVMKTMIHEHLVFDLSGVRNDTDSILMNNAALDVELEQLEKIGCNTIVEVSNVGMGRNAKALYEIARTHQLIIVASTGFYKELFYPSFVFEQSSEQLAEFFIKEITAGMDGTTVKAGLIAEIGSSLNEITKTEEKVFRAAIHAHLTTGAPISTHCEIGTMGLGQLELFEKHGADLSRISFGHQDLNTDIEEQRMLLKSGAYIQFDTFGKNSYRPDEERVHNLVRLLEDGFENQLMLSCDITRKSQLQSNGGYGYPHLFTSGLSLLRDKGVDEAVLNKMLVDNPKRFLAF